MIKQGNGVRIGAREIDYHHCNKPVLVLQISKQGHYHHQGFLIVGYQK
jgi:hypothetical protein